MGLDDDVINLCNEIYKKHRGAIDFIIANIEEDDGFSTFEEWGKEWQDNGDITENWCEYKQFVFRTPALEKLFPVTCSDGEIPCWYSVEQLPFPKRIAIEFGSQRFDDDAFEKFNKIKPFFNKRSIKDNWQWYKMKSWKLPEYNPDETDDFSEISDDLKAAVLGVIHEELPVFIKEIEDILAGTE